MAVPAEVVQVLGEQGHRGVKKVRWKRSRWNKEVSEMTECDYCGNELPKTAGKMLVLSDGSRFHFCSSKCEKNWEKDRNLEYAEN
ncbi:MAG: hypothetical protein SVS85_01200 [Candidatus Nanohaloarchaea archaeon]|nr:hypothetical protein [Candidatus Nanohaloarchaea archaeon]